MRIDDEVLAKAFWTIAIMIRPGARNSAKGTPPTWRTAAPSASANTARNSSVVTTGASDGLGRDRHEAPHLFHIEGPQSEPVDGAVTARRGRGENTLRRHGAGR